MTRVIGLFLLSVLFLSACNTSDKLYYFYADKDSTLVGVKNSQGKIIIPPERYYTSIDVSEEIEEETVFMWGIPDGLNVDKHNPVMACGSVYDRKGKFLYHPQFFDNGPDYWEEGVRRYVDGKKMGLVNRQGNKLTAAKWDFVEIMNYGYVKVSEGKLKKNYDSGGEHWSLEAEGEVVSYLVNNKGQRVEGYAVKKHPKDYFYDGKYYPYPFEYSDEEQKILDDLQKNIVGITFLFKSYYSEFEYTPVQLEITERPSTYQPYYVVKPFDGQEGLGYLEEFYVEAKNKKAFSRSYSESEVLLKDAMIQKLEEFLDFKDRVILPKTKEIAQQELKRLKSQP